MSKRTLTSVKRSLDSLTGVVCRSYGRCEHCGKAANKVQLQWCHIKSRRYLTTRWDPLNWLCLCAGCHRWFHDNPDEFIAWIEEEYPGRLEKLNRKFKKTTKMPMDERLELEKRLKRIVERIKADNEDPYKFP